MTNAKNTPGPWRFEKLRSGIIWAIEARGVRVAEIVRWATRDPEAMAEAEANARLIAAAPELLEALDDLRKYAKPVANVAYNPGQSDVSWHDIKAHIDRHDAAQCKAMDAIAKAKGETL